MGNPITIDLDDQQQVNQLRAALGIGGSKEPRVEPATIDRWAPGKDGAGEWVLAIAASDYKGERPYPTPRIVAVPNIYADGMEQFSAVNNRTKRSVYESKGLLDVPAPGSVHCPPLVWADLMSQANEERQRSKKPVYEWKPDEIPGPWGTAKPAKKEQVSGRA